MLRFLFFFILLQFSNSIQAQDIQFDENCVLFQDTKTSLPILILKDSILYKGNPLRKSKYNHTSYPDKLIHYVRYSIKGKTFLVQDGAGPVLEFRNDSIVNCNKISMFQNQIGSAKFVYKNELHLFGGYGLFTYKNIVTKYDAKNKDWEQVQTFGDEIPSPRSRFYSYVVNENLYVFGGYEDDPNDFLNAKKCDNFVWRLHLPTMQWHKIGKYDSNLLAQNTFLPFSTNDKLYLISTNIYGIVFEIDIVKNTIKQFTEKTLIKPTQIYFDNTKKELVCVTWISNGKYKIFQANLETFLGKPIEESEFIIPFYKEITTASFAFGIGILFIMIGIAIFLRKQKKNNLLPFNGIVFKKETGNCYYKAKTIDNLEEPELRILLYLIENAIRFVPLNELNHLFENGNNAENFSSIVKRREITLGSLLQKLSVLTKFPEKELLINRKNPDDKRIKEIRIAPSFLRIK
jgi:hypothetical protein